MVDMKWLASLNEYKGYMQRSETLRLYKLRLVDLLTRNWQRSKHLPGYSVTVGHMVDFTIDTKLTLPGGGYNLRETVNCPETGFNMRMRAAIHAITAFEQSDTGPVYICEQKTPMYRYFKNYFEDLVGSEYLDSGLPLG